MSVLRDFAARCTLVWCSQDPACVAASFSEDGSLRVNDDPPAVGRAAITGVVHLFMTAFPDLRVAIDDLLVHGDEAEYHWTLTGTNTGPQGTGHSVADACMQSTLADHPPWNRQSSIQTVSKTSNRKRDKCRYQT